MAWCSSWTAEDRDLIIQALELLPAVHLYAPPSDTYVAAWLWLPRATRTQSWASLASDEYGGSYDLLRAIASTPGNIEFRRSDLLPLAGHPLHARLREREVLPASGVCYFVYDVPLSPNRAISPGHRHPGDTTPVPCPTCFVALPATGVCDNCS